MGACLEEDFIPAGLPGSPDLGCLCVCIIMPTLFKDLPEICLLQEVHSHLSSVNVALVIKYCIQYVIREIRFRLSAL